MKRFQLNEAGDRGWYVGAFDKAVYKTDKFEVAFQYSAAGEVSEKHTHKVATEINLIAIGRAVVNGEVFNPGDGFIFNPGEPCEVRYETDTFTVVIKTPSVLGDKYYL